MQTAKNLMKIPITVDKESSLYDAITTMQREKISRLLVSEKGKLTGIITEKDVGLFLLEDKTERDIDEIPVVEATRRLHSVNESTKLGDCARTMLEKNFGSLGVNSNSHIIGLLTKTDLTKCYMDNYPAKYKVEEFMTKSYVSVYSDEPLHKVVSKLIENKISRIIVKGRKEIPVGIISFRDLFRIAVSLGTEEYLEDNTRPDITLIFSRKGFLSPSGFGEITSAAQLMTSGILSVLVSDNLAKACKILLENRVKGLGVLSANGNLVGILTKTDVAHALAIAE